MLALVRPTCLESQLSYAVVSGCLVLSRRRNKETIFDFALAYLLLGCSHIVHRGKPCFAQQSKIFVPLVGAFHPRGFEPRLSYVVGSGRCDGRSHPVQDFFFKIMVQVENFSVSLYDLVQVLVRRSCGDPSDMLSEAFASLHRSV